MPCGLDFDDAYAALAGLVAYEGCQLGPALFQYPAVEAAFLGHVPAWILGGAPGRLGHIGDCELFQGDKLDAVFYAVFDGLGGDLVPVGFPLPFALL